MQMIHFGTDGVRETAGKWPIDPLGAQHIGLGTRLLDQAAQIARQHGFQRLAVISAVGTRAYYRSRGFTHGDLYQVKELTGD